MSNKNEGLFPTSGVPLTLEDGRIIEHGKQPEEEGQIGRFFMVLDTTEIEKGVIKLAKGDVYPCKHELFQLDSMFVRHFNHLGYEVKNAFRYDEETNEIVQLNREDIEKMAAI